MRSLISIMFLSLTIPAFSQDMYTFTLEDSKKGIDSIHLNVVGIIDGRRNKSDIGWVQTGAFNKKRIANFEKPLTEEIGMLIEKAEIAPEEPPVVIRINHLHISEYTKAMSELGRAEISMDFFLKEGEDQYYFIGSIYSVNQQTSVDVTKQHSENVVSVIKKSLDQFGQRDWKNQVNRKETYDYNYIASGGQVKPDVSQIRIFNCQEYESGLFATFDEFLENNPSIVADYVVKVRNKPGVWLLKDGKKVKVKEGIYGFAHDGRLYVLFYKNYYPLQKGDDTFYFTGPYIVDSGAVASGAFLFGAVGGAITATTTGERKNYTIDMSGGFVIEAR